MTAQRRPRPTKGFRIGRLPQKDFLIMVRRYKNSTHCRPAVPGVLSATLGCQRRGDVVAIQLAFTSQNRSSISRQAREEPVMMLVVGPACDADPTSDRLPMALTSPNDQRRNPAHKGKPDYQHKDHKQILLSASSEGPGLNPGLSRLKLRCFAQEPAPRLPQKDFLILAR